MARVSLELGSRGTAQLRDADRDPDRRLHRGDLRVLVVGGGRARARDRARAAALAAAPELLVRARQRRDRARARRSSSASTTSTAGRRCGQRGGRPRGRRAGGAARRRPRRRAAPTAGIACFGPSGAAARLEGSKAFAKEMMVAAGVPDGRPTASSPTSRTGHGGDRALPGGDQGRRARRGQGRRDRPGRGRGARGAASSCWSSTASAPSRSWSRSTSRATSSRCWRCATASGRCRWPRRRTTSASATATAGPNTGGMGVVLAGAGDRARRAWRRSSATVHQPVVDELARRGTPFHGVLYAGLMLTGDGPQGARVQRPLRRPRDPGRAAAPAQRPARRCSGAPRGPAGWRARRSSGTTRAAVTVVLASRRLPGLLVAGRRDPRARRGPAGRGGHPRRHRAAATATSSPPAAAC